MVKMSIDVNVINLESKLWFDEFISFIYSNDALTVIVVKNTRERQQILNEIRVRLEDCVDITHYLSRNEVMLTSRTIRFVILPNVVEHTIGLHQINLFVTDQAFLDIRIGELRRLLAIRGYPNDSI